MDLKFGMQSGVPPELAPATVPGPPVASAEFTGLTHSSRAGVAVFFISLSLMFACMILYAQEQFTESLRSAFLLGEIVFIIIMIFAVIYVAFTQYVVSGHRSSAVLGPGAFDAAKFKKYRDYLDAVSIGAGISAPGLVVTDLAAPLAYVHPRYGIAVTSELLEADLCAGDIESIVAVLMARMILDRESETPGNYFDRQVKELELNESIVERVRYGFR
ncbi:MAG: hypothetical protein ACYC99_09140, partial [Candidatus Geothermincolia bacterium]